MQIHSFTVDQALEVARKLFIEEKIDVLTIGSLEGLRRGDYKAYQLLRTEGELEPATGEPALLGSQMIDFVGRCLRQSPGYDDLHAVLELRVINKRKLPVRVKRRKAITLIIGFFTQADIEENDAELRGIIQQYAASPN